MTCVREMLSRSNPCFVNFMVKSAQSKRLKVSDIIQKVPTEDGKRTKLEVNYEFWKEQRKKGIFDIYLDEVYMLAHARSSMTGFSRVATGWVAQIRKMLNGEEGNLYCVTQKPMRLDIAWRDLARIWVKCEKVKGNISMQTKTMKGKKLLPLYFIKLKYFNSLEALEAYESTGQRTYTHSSFFIANNFYKYYDTHEIIDFGQEEYV